MNKGNTAFQRIHLFCFFDFRNSHRQRIKPYYLEPKFINIGIDIIKIEGVKIKIYDRERTICDVLRYETKLEEGAFTNAIKNYIKDSKKCKKPI